MISSKIRDMAALLKVRLRGATQIAAALVFIAAGARGEEFRLFPESTVGPRSVTDLDWDFEPSLRIADFEHSYPWQSSGGTDVRIEIAGPLETAYFQEQEPPSTAAAPKEPPKKLFTTGTTLVTAGVLVGGFLQGLGAPLQDGWQSWSFQDEGWFGRDTYVGGADKVSHFVISSAVSRTLYEAYTRQGHTIDQSFNLALGTAFMAGAFVEIMDGVSVYGFSWEDLTVDALGAAAGLLIQRNHLQDLLGLRLGLATTTVPLEFVGSSVETLGHSYNDEIYAADFKPAGLVRRLGGKPGFERFFLTSFVFFTKGVGYDPPLPTRYQEIGFEVGLNFPEILRAFGVSEKTWWGTGLIAIFNFFRFPYTQVGVYYNLFDNKWYGPGAPYHYY